MTDPAQPSHTSEPAEGAPRTRASRPAAGRRTREDPAEGADEGEPA